MSSGQMGSCAQFLRGTAVPAPHGVGSCAWFLQGIAVPAPHVFQTDGLLRPIFTRGGGSCAQRRRFLRPTFTGDRGSCASCLPDRWVPAPDCYEGRWFLRPAASVPAPDFLQGIAVPAPHVFQTDGFLRPCFIRGGGSCARRRRFLRLVGRGSRARAALAGTWRPSFQAAGRALRAPATTSPSPTWFKFSLPNYSPNWPVR